MSNHLQYRKWLNTNKYYKNLNNYIRLMSYNILAPSNVFREYYQQHREEDLEWP